MKEILAAVLLVLLLIGTMVNSWYLDSLVESMVEMIDESEAMALDSDFDAAAEKLREVIDTWEDASGYTYIMIRHSEIDSSTDAFYTLMSDLHATDFGRAAGTYEKLRSHLRSIASMEHVNPGTVF